MKNQEISKILWKAQRDVRKLMYDSKGNTRKGLRKKQKRAMGRISSWLCFIRMDMGEGIYISTHNKKSYEEIVKYLYDIDDRLENIEEQLKKEFDKK